MTVDDDASEAARQHRHWSEVFAANPDMYGTAPSDAAVRASEVFAARGVRSILELGAGQGRDTIFLATQGFDVVALDYVDEAIRTISAKAAGAGMTGVTVVRHDARRPLPFVAESFDACYSHMLFCMALTTTQIKALVSETRRVLRPGGTLIYTVRHTGDAHYGTGIAHGDDMFENAEFVVHFFDDALVQRLSTEFELLDVVPFTEGDLPRNLWQVTMRKPGNMS